MTQQITMSKMEVNIRRLLGRCELLAKEDSHQDWRLEKYIDALNKDIRALQQSSKKPSRDKMAEYIRRADFLKGVIETQKLNNPIERAVAAQMLPRACVLTNTSSNIVTQIHQKTAAKYNKELQNELFHGESDEGNLRQRIRNDPVQGDDLDALLKYNRNMQEKIAENMLLMTSSMKEHALTASAIIKRDVAALENSDTLTEINAAKLKTESLKLEEHTKSTWRCWVWLMVAFVFTVFFNMVLFMKVAKKRD